MDAILFSADPKIVNISGAIKHLSDHKKVYWEIGFSINRERFLYPILGYVHVCGEQVEYVATIEDIKSFSLNHYENKELSLKIKPVSWLRDWIEDRGGCRTQRRWKNVLVMSHIEPFTYNTYDFQKYGGGLVKHAPQNYIRVLQPK
jgi:hypothetical protein